MVTGVAQGLMNEFSWVIYTSLAIASLFGLFLVVLVARGLFLWAMRGRAQRRA